MQSSSSELSLKKVLIFWLPLASTWLMMSLEGPFLTAVIARLADPKFNLAAYGVAFSFALIIEAPVIMIISASIALVKNYDSFIMLKKFTFIMISIITAIMLILLIPSVFYFLTISLIKLPTNVAELTHIATIILIPWPGAIGYRRFYQGILIRNGLTKRVAYGTIIRVLTMVTTAFLLYMFSDIPGVVLGAISLSTAVIMEAIASRIMVIRCIHKLKLQTGNDDESISFKSIYNFYYPLALTSLIGLGVQPLVTLFVGQSKMALESLAVLPVVTSFVFMFRALGLSYQEVVIAMMAKKEESIIYLKKFAVLLGTILTVTLTIVAVTPLSDFWFGEVSGLSEKLTQFSKLPLIIMSIFPALSLLISFQRAVLVHNNYTKPITTATVMEFSIIILILFFSINTIGWVGAAAATASLVLGRLSSNFYLTFPVLKVLKKQTTARSQNGK